MLPLLENWIQVALSILTPVLLLLEHLFIRLLVTYSETAKEDNSRESC